MEEYQEALEATRRAAQRMQFVVEGLLKLARGDAGQLPLQLQPHNLEPLVKDICRLLNPMIQAKRLQLYLDPQPVFAMVDRDLIGEAISNVITNAVGHNHQEGQIDVKLRVNDDHVELSVSDTGPGIPVADQPHVFDRFYRVDKARGTANGRGSGLGLAITKWIVDAHQGSLRFTSEEGVGTEFIMHLKNVAKADSATPKTQS